MNQLTTFDVQRACNLAKALGAKLHKTAQGWMFKLEVSFRDDKRLKDFQSWFYTPMSPVHRAKKPCLLGSTVQRTVYSAVWEFVAPPEAEQILRTEFDYKDLPIG